MWRGVFLGGISPTEAELVGLTQTNGICVRAIG